MNTLESTTIISPFGDMDECAKFTIYEVTDPFTLHNITHIAQQYTFSCWVKSNIASSIMINGNMIDTSAVWNRVKIQFIADSVDMRILFRSPSIFYIYNAQLEVGNMPSDWTPAPEDVDQSIEDVSTELRQVVSDSHTSIISDCEQIILSALKSYTETNDFEAFKQVTESQLKLLSDSMVLQFTQTTERLEQMNSDTQQQLNTITKYFSFDIDGLTIGQVDSPNKVLVDNDEISILVNGNVVQRFDATGKATIPELYVTRTANLVGLLVQDAGDTLDINYSSITT